MIFPSFLYMSRTETRRAAKGRRQPFHLEIKMAIGRGLAVRISCQTRKAVL